MCDKRDRAITREFCRGLPLSLMFSGLLQKGLFKGRCSLVKCFFKQNYCHACHARFAVFFPLLSCCVSSLLPHPRRVICLAWRVRGARSFMGTYLPKMTRGRAERSP